jgi:hypothetical protein
MPISITNATTLQELKKQQFLAFHAARLAARQAKTEATNAAPEPEKDTAATAQRDPAHAQRVDGSTHINCAPPVPADPAMDSHCCKTAETTLATELACLPAAPPAVEGINADATATEQQGQAPPAPETIETDTTSQPTTTAVTSEAHWSEVSLLACTVRVRITGGWRLTGG